VVQTPVTVQDTQPECFTITEPAEQLQAGFRGWWSRKLGVFVIVDGYANFIGSIGGIVLSIVLLAVWLVIGSVMGYSNGNWWLIIGTYTGLVRLSYMPIFICKSNNAQTNIIDTLQRCLSVHRWSSSVVNIRATWLGLHLSTCMHCCCASLQQCALSVGAGEFAHRAGALVDWAGALVDRAGALVHRAGAVVDQAGALVDMLVHWYTNLIYNPAAAIVLSGGTALAERAYLRACTATLIVSAACR